MSEYRAKSNVIWGDINLQDYNAFAFYCNIFNRPERDVDIVSVPGRNGDLIFDNGRYKNVDRIYQIHVAGVDNAMALVSDISEQIGYYRLQDEYEDDVYMEARLKKPPTISKFVGDYASITLTLDRKPHKYFLDDSVKIYADAVKRIQLPNSNHRVIYEFVIDNQFGVDTRPLICIRPLSSNDSSTYYFSIVKSDTRLDIDDPDVLPSPTSSDPALIRGRINLEDAFSEYVDIDCESRMAIRYADGKIVPFINTTLYVIVRGDYPFIGRGVNYFYVYFDKNAPYHDPDYRRWDRETVIYPRWRKV